MEELLSDVVIKDATALETTILKEVQDVCEDSEQEEFAPEYQDNGQWSTLETIDREISVLANTIKDGEINGKMATSEVGIDLHMARLQERLEGLKNRKKELKATGAKGGMTSCANTLLPANCEQGPSMFVETEKDRLIRLGIVTPFDNISGFDKEIAKANDSASTEPSQSETYSDSEDSNYSEGSEDMRGNYPNAEELSRKYSASLTAWQASRPRTRLVDAADLPSRARHTAQAGKEFWRTSGTVGRKRSRKIKRNQRRLRRKRFLSESAGGALSAEASQSLDQQDNSDLDTDDSANDSNMPSTNDQDFSSYLSNHTIDDEDDAVFKDRIEALGPQLTAREGVEYVEFEGGYRIPTTLYDKLFEYQKTGIKWLWELHTQKTGGIVGDEMGLGKTVQVCTFLGGLHVSKLYKPTLIIVPATVLRQWVQEFHAWYPWLRVVVVHNSAGNPSGARKRTNLIDKIAKSTNGVLLTTYDHLRIYQQDFLKPNWGYVVLDEGHKIRNPDADITLVCKQVRTVHRIIMTGTPLQNRLSELWSLFDFVFPGRLGTLPVFKVQFGVPIQIGGYINATRFQASTAYKCAVILRDLIAPYILQRRKIDVGTQLPKKKEQILFCSLTDTQRKQYQEYTQSADVAAIVEGRRNALAGIDTLRKICNHPDLLEIDEHENPQDYGAPERSAKLMITMKILRHWKTEGHKALLFCQTQQMLDIVEDMCQREGYVYHRMDGSTGVGSRGRIIHDFNTNKNVFLFLLTTRVGGIGVNLTGANRVLLFDPDWNPSTDVQARERAWRIGQKRDVTIYRLITSGTIEDKIYQRQVYKQFLSNKVLRDPKQKRFFASKDIRQLFTFGDEISTTGTSGMFQSSGEGAVVTATSTLDSSVLVESNLERENKRSADLEDGELESPNKSSDNSDGEKNKEGDTKILRELFAKGVKGAMDHARIESVHADEDIETFMEANNIAREAAAKLRESRRMCQSNSVTVPTWTGRSGISGAPSNRNRFGSRQTSHLPAETNPAKVTVRFIRNTNTSAPSSSSILSAMRARKAEASSEGCSNFKSSIHAKLAESWMSQMIEFLCVRNGEARSSDVISHFEGQVQPQDRTLFRSVLKQVATLHKRGEQGVWVVKDEFREN